MKTKIKRKYIKCVCCRKRIIAYSNNTSMCSHCAVYCKELTKKISYYKSKAEMLSLKLYGTTSGNERVRSEDD